jgi:exopolysaccharide biosynthesis polyprenyl glycosylphosphotransferase
MPQSTLEKSVEKSNAPHNVRSLPAITAGRDLRARRSGLFAILTNRRLILRLINGLVLAAIDLFLLFASLLIALRLKTVLTSDPTSLATSYDYTVAVLPFAALVMLLLFAGDGLYGPRNLRPGAARILGALFKVTVVTLLFALIEGERFQSYYIFWATFIVASILIVGSRTAYDRVSTGLEQAFGRKRRAVIVGTNQQIQAVDDAIERAPVRRIHPVGFISLEPRVENGLRNLGSIGEIEDHFDEIDEVIVADPAFPVEEMVMLVDRCHRGGVQVRVAPTTMEILRADVSEFVPGETLPLFEIKPPVFDGAQFIVKRCFDIVVAALLLVLFSPLLLLVALAVKLTSRGPVFFLSPRPGLGGESFNCIKFRTMVTNAASLQDELERHNEADGAIFKIRRDPRLTRIGGFLRRWSIDELPQLFNVLKGEMSLVGPRPLPQRDYQRLEEWHKKRYLVLPGLTGLWQVSGRSELDFDDLVRLDFHYIERWSVFLDIVIMLRTVPAVVAKRGAY